MCYLKRDTANLTRHLQSQFNFKPSDGVGRPNLSPAAWYRYALLVLVTDTTGERAQTYLEDTGDPKAAAGRLLLRAAEKALREYGDTPASDREKQEGDED